MPDIVINPSLGKIDFFTVKGEQVTNSMRLGDASTILFTGALSASSISTGGGGAFVTSVQPTTNYLSKFTGNSTIANSLVYDNGTNVGIGTTSPGNKFEVKGADDAAITAIFQSTAGGNAAYNGGIQLGNAASSQNSQIYHNSSGDNTLTFVSNYSSGTGNKFIFSPGGTEKVRFQQNGNVGIGTTVPIAKLHVSWGTDAQSVKMLGAGGSTNGNFIYSLASDWSDTFGLNVFATAHVNNAARTNNLVRIHSNETSNGSLPLRVTAQGTIASPTYEALAVNYLGNVGIGTTSPAAKLHLNSTVADATLLRTDGTSGTLFSVVDDLSDSLMSVNNSAGLPVLEVFADDRIVAGQYGQNDLVVVNNKVGIGTNNPTSKLHVSGSVEIDGLTTNATGYYLTVDNTTGVVYKSTATAAGSSGTSGSSGSSGTSGSSGSSGTSGSSGSSGTSGSSGSSGTSGSSGSSGTSGSSGSSGTSGSSGSSGTSGSSGSSGTSGSSGSSGTSGSSGSSGTSGSSVSVSGTTGYIVKFNSASTIENTATPIFESGSCVGIGLTAPDLRLHIEAANAYPASSGTTPTGFLTLRAKTAGGTHGMYMGVSNASPYGSWIQCSDSTNLAANYPLLLNPNGGNVGIGTTSPLSTLNLQSAAPTILTLGSTSYPSTFLTTLGVDSGARGFLIFGNNGENQIRAGRTTTGGYLDFYTNNTVAQTTLASDGNFVMRLAANGNVGIGTTIPGAKLQINNVGDSRLIVYETGTAPYTATLELSSQVYGTYGGTIQYNASPETLTIENYGRTATNSVQGSILFKTKINNTTATNVMLINGFTGNVGIGTTNPTTLLHVVGVISGSSFSGAGTGLTGTAAGLSIGGNAATATTAANGGVTSISAGTGIGTSASTGAVTITNSSPNATHTGDVTGATALTIANDAVTTVKILNSNVTNAKLANSAVTIGSTAVSLGATATTIAGLTSVTSTTFVGALTGNASTATNSTQLGGTVASKYIRNDSDGTAGDIFSLITVTKSLTLTTSWIDTGISGTSDLANSGAYIITMNADNHAVGGGQYNETYTGIMYWYAGGTNDAGDDEIVLHKSGHAPNAVYINLRTLRTASGTLKLQIISSAATNAASNYIFKFRRIT